MAYARGAYRHHSSLPAPARPALHSSRRYNAATKRFENDTTTGGELGMPSTRQRVLIACMFNLPPSGGILDDRAISKREADIRSALAPLATGPEPAIIIKRVTALREQPGKTVDNIDWQDLHVGVDDTVQLP